MEFTSYSHFNALEISVRQRMTYGFSVFSQLTVQHSYGASGYIDPYNFDYGKGMLASATGHQFATSLSSTT